MSSTLISFLGRVPKDANSRAYSETSYRFSEDVLRRSAYFGFSLLEEVRPERFVVLGTSGSMWDHLFAGHTGDDVTALIREVDADHVSQERLTSLEPVLSRALGVGCTLTIIPYARCESEQIAIVKMIADASAGATRLHFDITHGFRHLPLLSLTALQYIRAARPSVAIEKIWYAAYDGVSKVALVHDLSVMLDLLDAAEAVMRLRVGRDDTKPVPASIQPLLREALARIGSDVAPVHDFVYSSWGLEFHDPAVRRHFAPVLARFLGVGEDDAHALVASHESAVTSSLKELRSGSVDLAAAYFLLRNAASVCGPLPGALLEARPARRVRQTTTRSALGDYSAALHSVFARLGRSDDDMSIVTDVRLTTDELSFEVDFDCTRPRPGAARPTLVESLRSVLQSGNRSHRPGNAASSLEAFWLMHEHRRGFEFNAGGASFVLNEGGLTLSLVSCDGRSRITLGYPGATSA